MRPPWDDEPLEFSRLTASPWTQELFAPKPSRWRRALRFVSVVSLVIVASMGHIRITAYRDPRCR